MCKFGRVQRQLEEVVKVATVTCLCGKDVVMDIGKGPFPHRPKKNFQPRFFEMSRKDRKAMWCDVWDRMSRVSQRAITDRSFKGFEQADSWQALKALQLEEALA